MKKKLLNHSFIEELLINDKITILDGGARGEIFAPFNKVTSNTLKVIKFEPDPEAKIVESEDSIIVPKGLWNSKKSLTLNVATSPAASSLFEFNTKLQSYIDPSSNFRTLDKKVKVDCISIDEFISDSNIDVIDFIKLDIHGSEYDVLVGARDALQKTIGLLIESWTIPIHINQKTRGAVEDLINNQRFYLFEEFVQAKWARINSSHSKKQPIAVDSLYFKDPLLDLKFTDKVRAIKLIGIADLFNHTGFAIQLNDHFLEVKLIDRELHQKCDVVLKNNFKENAIDKIKYKLLSKIERYLNLCAFR